MKRYDVRDIKIENILNKISNILLFYFYLFALCF